MVPSVGSYRRSRVRPVVVLPQPDSPTRPASPPCGWQAAAMRPRPVNGTACSCPCRRRGNTAADALLQRDSRSSGFAPLLKFFLLAQPAIGVVGVAQFGSGRHLVQADLHAALAARRKRAACGRVQQVNGLTLDGHQTLLLLGVSFGMELIRPFVYSCWGL